MELLNRADEPLTTKQLGGTKASHHGRTLAWMYEKGLVWRTDRSVGKKRRFAYSLTNLGREALAAFKAPKERP